MDGATAGEYISKGPSDGLPAGASSREENTQGTAGGASGSLTQTANPISSDGMDGSVFPREAA